MVGVTISLFQSHGSPAVEANGANLTVFAADKLDFDGEISETERRNWLVRFDYGQVVKNCQQRLHNEVVFNAFWWWSVTFLCDLVELVPRISVVECEEGIKLPP
jgi:hypothetical protein